MQSRLPAWVQVVAVPSALAAALSTFCLPAGAAPAATDLDNVVVTATRTAQTQDATLAAVTVIDRAQIERLQPLSLPDLLRGLPGISIANNGGPGKATSLFLRGTESDHTLVLVDGLRLGSATTGGASLQDIPLEQIERIEIVRGPFSSLYGSEAIGGVIQIFTRRPASAFVPNLTVGVGSFDSTRAGAGIAGRGAAGWYALQVGHEQTEGINAYLGNPRPFRPERFLDPDLDGYRNRSLSLRAGTRVADAWTLETRALRVETRNEYDGSLNNMAKGVQQVAGARARYAPGDAIAVTLDVGRTADRSDAYRDGVYSSTFDTIRELASLQADLAAGPGLLTLGADWRRDEVEGSTRYRVSERITRGLFAQWQQDIGAHALQLNARRDEDGQFGTEATGSALWGWDFTDGLRLTASVGTAFKAPTFNELYFPGYGREELQPESSRSAEIGLRGRHGVAGWSVHAFRTEIEDLIAYDRSIGLFGGPNNIEQARVRGVEAAFDTDLSGWAVRGSATWLDPRNEVGSNAGKVLPRRARSSGRLDLDRDFGVFDAGLGVVAAGARYDDIANTRRLGGYALTDLRLGVGLGEDWSLQFTAGNVFDRRYETASFYNQPGRSYFVTLRYRPAN